MILRFHDSECAMIFVLANIPAGNIIIPIRPSTFEYLVFLLGQSTPRASYRILERVI